ncbi:hypothetical protein M427DRAFT_269294 [Gonapodya prolifera JEL478]|uniref:Uncharacterized protein n=1 Tax=Gonapodya prolifera (strain JEL478) TaxID=1344416 RepID=A0A139AJT6_GONPJ|nr:hypothetical protein M427DRAFT_269294 [Gonapodya prolifera JEL478]|eukprot:KXS17047.1 hypothetical protein M427DRAFT_269294 [Gonapodya prolifera JEL478]
MAFVDVDKLDCPVIGLLSSHFPSQQILLLSFLSTSQISGCFTLLQTAEFRSFTLHLVQDNRKKGEWKDAKPVDQLAARSTAAASVSLPRPSTSSSQRRARATASGSGSGATGGVGGGSGASNTTRTRRHSWFGFLPSSLSSTSTLTSSSSSSSSSPSPTTARARKRWSFNALDPARRSIARLSDVFGVTAGASSSGRTRRSSRTRTAPNYHASSVFIIVHVHIPPSDLSPSTSHWTPPHLPILRAAHAFIVAYSTADGGSVDGLFRNAWSVLVANCSRDQVRLPVGGGGGGIVREAKVVVGGDERVERGR